MFVLYSCTTLYQYFFLNPKPPCIKFYILQSSLDFLINISLFFIKINWLHLWWINNNFQLGFHRLLFQLRKCMFPFFSENPPYFRPLLATEDTVRLPDHLPPVLPYRVTTEHTVGRTCFQAHSSCPLLPHLLRHLRKAQSGHCWGSGIDTVKQTPAVSEFSGQ